MKINMLNITAQGSQYAHGQLITDINRARPDKNEMFFWWLGQHSYIVKAAGKVIYFDPFLSAHKGRLQGSILSGKEAANADFVFCSHDHGDHLDVPSLPEIARSSPRALFIAPKTASEKMKKLVTTPKRLKTINADETIVLPPLRVTAIKAKHEEFDHVQGVGYPCLGFIVQTPAGVIYHAGDTLCYEGLATTLKRWRIDLAFIPINGRDGARLERNCLGNMTFQEAVDLAGEIKPAIVVPSHYGMFGYNTEDPVKFAHYLQIKYPRQKYWFGPMGTRVEIHV